MNKIISIILMIAILATTLFILTGCDNNKGEAEEVETSETETKKDKKKDKKDEENDDEDEVEDEEEEEDEEDKKESKTEKKKTSKKNKKSSADLGDKYVDLDNRSFAVNGKVYTLGKTTLQEMIDDGVPFKKDDVANANNNLNKNSESQSFSIELGKYYSAQVRVANDSKDNMKIAECKLSEIYLPVHQDEEQDILSFAFPLTIKEEELLDKAGEPTDKSEYNGNNDYQSRKYEYKVDSTKYYGSSGYTFEYVNGELKYVTITYKP